MIKLIATDLDGTFLDSKKNKPADFPEVFKEIKRRGITFAAASGRDYNGAAMYFKDYTNLLETKQHYHMERCTFLYHFHKTITSLNKRKLYQA